MRTPCAPLLVLVAFAAGGGAHAQDGGSDGGLLSDAGVFDDAGVDDAGVDDAGTTSDAGEATDGGVGVDAGLDDAGTACSPTCEGDTLVFCDNGDEVEIDCALEGGRCGLLDAEWGNDCLLPENATCSPGYAEGRSRCDRDANLTCLVDVCGDCPTADCAPTFPSAPLVPGSSGDVPTVPGTEDNALSCLGCTDTPNLPFIALLFGMGISRAIRSRRRRG